MQLIVDSGFPLRNDREYLQGITLPGDKSLSHRAALFAGLANGTSRIRNFLSSGVTHAMLNALSELSVFWYLEGDLLTVEGKGLYGLKSSGTPINCGNSATTMRLLAGAVAASGIDAELTGSKGLQRRPMDRIVEPLRLMGVDIQSSERGTAPISITGQSDGQYLQPIDYSLHVASAQVKSCLLLAALNAQGTTILREPGPSRDHTERMLRNMGVKIESRKSAIDGINGKNEVYETSISPQIPMELKPLDLVLPGDISSAAFLIVAALITPGSNLTIRNIGLNSTRTGIIDALNMMGAEIQIVQETENDHSEPVGDIIVVYKKLKGVKISGSLVVRMIDEFPVFAIAAAYASGTTVVQDAIELRNKESDRIAALITELSSLGIDAQESEDGFIIHGGKSVQGGSVNTHGDHRLAMSLAVCGLASEAPVIVNGAEIINESFPEFINILQKCGAQLSVRE